MKEKIKKVFSNWYFLSFVLGAVAYYLFLSYSQVAGGKYALLEGDTLDSVAYTRMFFDNILNGKGVAYTWSTELGINNYPNLAGVISITMPIDWLFGFLATVIDMSIITAISIALKAGLASLFFYLFMDKVWNIKGISNLLFSVLYAMCGFQVAYIPFLLGFEDAVYTLPLLLYLVSRFASNGNYKLMCIVYLNTFLKSYYSAYIIGFFSFFYLILYLFFINRYTVYTVIKKLLLFGICVVITAGISAMVLYPIEYFIMTKYSEDATKLNTAPVMYLHDIYNQLFIGQNCKINNGYPYIYCGLPVMLLIPFYFVNKKISGNEKIVDISLLALMLASGIILPLYLFWHLFDAPDFFPFRYSFLISFILCVMACKQSVHLKKIKSIHILILIGINLVVYLICMNIQKYFQIRQYNYPENTWVYFIINAIYLLVYYVWFVFYQKKYDDEKLKNGIAMLIFMIVVSETVLNGVSSYYKDESLMPSNYYDSYKLWEDTTEAALDKIRSEASGFYRINCNDDYTSNGPIYFNYNGISSFSNMENYEVRKALGNMGIAVSPRFISTYGLTDFSRMILSVLYDIDSVDFADHKMYTVREGQEAGIRKNDYCLSLGFAVDDDIKQFSFESSNQFENMNKLASTMVGSDVKLYELVDNDISYEEMGISIDINDDGRPVYQLTNDDEHPDNGSLIISVPDDERDAYVQFEYSVSLLDTMSPYIFDPSNGQTSQYERLGMVYITKMADLEDVYSIGVFMDASTYGRVYTPDSINFAYYNKDQFINTYEKLKDNQMEISDYGNGWVNGHIDINEDGKVLFTSIPFDDGWEIKANGVELEPIKLLDGAFIGLELPKGSYEIEFRYHVPGIKTGMIIAGTSLLLLIGLFLLNIRIKTETRKIIEK